MIIIIHLATLHGIDHHQSNSLNNNFVLQLKTVKILTSLLLQWSKLVRRQFQFLYDIQSYINVIYRYRHMQPLFKSLAPPLKWMLFLPFRYSHPREPTYWSRQSLSSPSPVETEMDMLVLRERSRRGIHNNGYDVSIKGTNPNTHRPSQVFADVVTNEPLYSSPNLSCCSSQSDKEDVPLLIKTMVMSKALHLHCAALSFHQEHERYLHEFVPNVWRWGKDKKKQGKGFFSSNPRKRWRREEIKSERHVCWWSGGHHFSSSSMFRLLNVKDWIWL